MHMTEKNVWRILQANVRASVLMVMNHGAEAHAMYTVAFRYFRTKI